MKVSFCYAQLKPVALVMLVEVGIRPVCAQTSFTTEAFDPANASSVTRAWVNGGVGLNQANYESAASNYEINRSVKSWSGGLVNGGYAELTNVSQSFGVNNFVSAGMYSSAGAANEASQVTLFSYAGSPNNTLRVDLGGISLNYNGNSIYNSLTVDGTGVKVNGNALLSTADLQSYAQLSGAAFTGNVNVAGSTTTNGLTNTGDISTATLSTSGLATLNSVAVTNSATLGGTLGVAGVTTLGSTLLVGGATTLNGSTQVNHTLGVTGAVTLGSTMSVADATTLNGATTVNNTLTVTGATNINTTGAAATNIGSTNAVSVFTAQGGNSQLSVTNNKAELRSGTGTASNGKLGTGALIGGGGFASYANAQTVTNGSTVGNLLEGNQYVNRINGNALIDGNLYINGALNYVSSNAANTAVLGSGVQTSNLAGATQATSGGTAVVMKGATASQAVVDANGKIFDTASTSIADQSTAALTLTNGLGNTHGVVVTESQTTLSGGNLSTSMTLNDNGARFSNSATGAPVTVTGVADGRSDSDAVNVRQFAGAVASTAAMTNIPGVDTNKQASIGIGFGNFMGHSALAFGGNYRFSSNGVFKASVATGLNSGGSQATVGLGAGWSW